MWYSIMAVCKCLCIGSAYWCTMFSLNRLSGMIMLLILLQSKKHHFRIWHLQSRHTMNNVWLVSRSIMCHRHTSINRTVSVTWIVLLLDARSPYRDGFLSKMSNCSSESVPLRQELPSQGSPQRGLTPLPNQTEVLEILCDCILRADTIGLGMGRRKLASRFSTSDGRCSGWGWLGLCCRFQKLALAT